MITCPECGNQEKAGALFCGECGNFLLDERLMPQPKSATGPSSSREGATKITTGKQSVLHTKEFKYRPPFAENLQPPPPNLVGLELGPEVEIQPLIFIIPNSGRRVRLELRNEVLIGRSDPTSSTLPALDLARDNGAQLGVSRIHAMIQKVDRGVTIMDLGSTNGTYLNNYRLPPDLPYALRSGDEVRFSHLLVHIFFG